MLRPRAGLFQPVCLVPWMPDDVWYSVRQSGICKLDLHGGQGELRDEVLPLMHLLSPISTICKHRGGRCHRRPDRALIVFYPRRSYDKSFTLPTTTHTSAFPWSHTFSVDLSRQSSSRRPYSTRQSPQLGQHFQSLKHNQFTHHPRHPHTDGADNAFYKTAVKIDWSKIVKRTELPEMRIQVLDGL